jgi:uncharacterized protein YjbJ (UPF0337 family)
MTTTEAIEDWDKMKGVLKEKFTTLTDDDLFFEEGKKDEMFGKLHLKLGIEKQELNDFLSGI